MGIFHKTLTGVSLFVYCLSFFLFLFFLSFKVVGLPFVFLTFVIFIAISLLIEYSSIFDKFRKYKSTHKWFQICNTVITLFFLATLFLLGGNRTYLIVFTSLYCFGIIQEIVERRYVSKYFSRCLIFCRILLIIVLFRFYLY